MPRTPPKKAKPARDNSFLQPDENTKRLAKYIAIAVRNAMEGFHVAHLTDAQMKELNPIIRNAICSALHAYLNVDNYPNAREWMDFQMQLIPPYWEEPEIAPFLRRENDAAEESPAG